MLRVKQIFPAILAFALMFFLTSDRFRTVQEHVLSPHVYWSGDQAIVTMTTKVELRTQSPVSRLMGLVFKRGPGVMRVGKAHVYTWKNGHWTHVELRAGDAPNQFELWPYDGKFYSWDYRHPVREWNGQALVAVTPQRAAELKKSFPDDPNNYVPADEDESDKAYGVMQDPITRQEWHEYDDLALWTPAGRLPFNVGDAKFEINTRWTDAKAAPKEMAGLTINGPGEALKLWEAPSAARTVTKAEYDAYSLAPILPRPRAQLAREGFAILRDLAVTLVVIFLIGFLSMGAIKPALLASSPAEVELADARVADYPKMDVARLLDYTRRLEALGFVAQKDVTMANGAGKQIKNFARIFVHPKAYCYADVHQIFSAKTRGLRCAFGSYIGEDWTVGIGDDPPNAGSAVIRLAKKVSFSRPGMPLEEMFRKHLESRDKIAFELGLPVVKMSSYEDYRERESQNAAIRHENLKNTNTYLLVLRYYKAKFNKQYDWLGDYPKAVRERTGQMAAQPV